MSEDKRISRAETRRQGQAHSSSSSSGSDGDSDGDSDSQPSTPLEFAPEQCLFCNQANDTFKESISHMSKNHSFIIPYQEALAIDIETVVEYVHLVVFGYHECILCSTRRGTLEAIQQHMTAKGHCRLELNSETTEFYKLSPEQLGSLSGVVHSNDGSLRLPSGKLLGHRTQRNDTTLRSQVIDDDKTKSRSRLPSRNTDTTLPIIENGSPAPSMQLAHLCRGDQRSLAHLRSHEVQALISAGMKDIDRSRRQETRSQLKVGRSTNTTILTRSQMGYRVNLRAG